MWRILQLSLFLLAFLGGLSISPLPASPDTTGSWSELVLALPFSIAFEIGVFWFHSKRNPAFIPWHAPSLNQNPFNPKQVLAFSRFVCGFLSCVGIGNVIRALLSGGLLGPTDGIFFVIGGVGLAGIYLFMHLFPQFVASSDVAKNLGV